MLVQESFWFGLPWCHDNWQTGALGGMPENKSGSCPAITWRSSSTMFSLIKVAYT